MSAPDRTAVGNFLASLDGLTYQEAVANCEADKASYGWSHETSGAIREGIAKHFGIAPDAARCQYCGFTAGEAEKEFEAEELASGVLDEVCGILFGDADVRYDSLDDPAYDLLTKARALVAAS